MGPGFCFLGHSLNRWGHMTADSVRAQAVSHFLTLKGWLGFNMAKRFHRDNAWKKRRKYTSEWKRIWRNADKNARRGGAWRNMLWWLNSCWRYCNTFDAGSNRLMLEGTAECLCQYYGRQRMTRACAHKTARNPSLLFFVVKIEFRHFFFWPYRGIYMI